jgi:hypothetical protein
MNILCGIYNVLYAIEDGGAGGGGATGAEGTAPAAEGGVPPSGGGGTGGGTEGTTPAAGAEEVEDDFKGWWATQLPKETIDKHRDRLLALKGKKLSDVLDDHFSTSDRLKDAIALPGKDAKPEEIDSFLQKMNIPKTAAGYNLDARKLPEGWTDEAKKNTAAVIAEACKRNGLTVRQGNAMYGFYLTHIQDIKARGEAQRQKLKETFDERLTAECGDEKTSSATVEYFKRAMVALADKRFVKEMTDSGMIYNPVVVRAIADLWKAGNSEPPVMSAGGGREEKAGEGGFPKSPQFVERYGRGQA